MDIDDEAHEIFMGGDYRDGQGVEHARIAKLLGVEVQTLTLLESSNASEVLDGINQIRGALEVKANSLATNEWTERQPHNG